MKRTMKDIIDQLCELTEQEQLKWEGGYHILSECYSYRARIADDKMKTVNVMKTDGGQYSLSANSIVIDTQMDAKRLFDAVHAHLTNEDAERRAQRSVSAMKQLRAWLNDKEKD